MVSPGGAAGGQRGAGRHTAGTGQADPGKSVERRRTAPDRGPEIRTQVRLRRDPRLLCRNRLGRAERNRLLVEQGQTVCYRPLWSEMAGTDPLFLAGADHVRGPITGGRRSTQDEFRAV